MEEPRFRVIIVGAGPVGLYLAHAMVLGNIDFVVLEQRPTVGGLNGGSMIFLWPQTVRLLDQIGVYQLLKEHAVELHEKKRVFGGNGKVFTTSQLFDNLHEHHGYPFLPIVRGELVRGLHEGLAGKAKHLRTGVKVISIENTGDSVSAHLSDGSVEKGSFIIGADGVHSITRGLVQSTGDACGFHKEHETRSKAEKTMVAYFYGLVGRASNDLGIENGVFFESRGGGAVLQGTVGGGTIYFATYSPLSEPTSAKRRYTRKDMDDYAQSVGHIFFCPGVRFRDIWARADKSVTVMINQEEGFVDTPWHHGRIVLAGDAVHKTTSINGLGLTVGLHSAAALANEVRGLAAVAQGVVDAITINILDEAFTRYRKIRKDEAQRICKDGFTMIRSTTARTWASWFSDKYILPWTDIDNKLGGMVISQGFVRHGQILSYVPFKDKRGSVEWARVVEED